MTQASHARVLIADNDGASRAGIRLALADQGFDVCAEAGTAAAAVDAALRSRPDLCVIDGELPGGALAATQEIVHALPASIVVMLGASVDDERLFSALDAGARGYLPKSMDPDRLPAALMAALDGETALPRSLVGSVVEEFRARKRGRHAVQLARLGVTLTRREREVFELLSQDLDTAQIADLLTISTVTVRRHVSAILAKLGAPDRKSALRALHDPPGEAFTK